MELNNSKKCVFIKPDKKGCNAWAMTGSNFCFTHNPETKKQKRAAVIMGGKGNKRKRSSLEAVEIKDSKDVVMLIVKTINEVRQGVAEVRIANCIFYGTGQLIKALEIAELEGRVAEIEKVILEKNLKN